MSYMPRLAALLVLIGLTLVLLGFPSRPAAAAAAWQLDASFGTGGVVRTNVNNLWETGTAVAIQPDGKIVVASGIVSRLFRYLPSGQLDPDFGQNGIVATSLRSSLPSSHSLLLQPDSKIVVAGYFLNGSAPTTFAAARYLDTGQPDSSFGQNGVLRIDIPNAYAYAGTVLRQPSGAFVFAGVVKYSGSSGSVMLVGTDADGQIDPGFGDDGITLTPAPAQPALGNYVGGVLQSNGSIVIVAIVGSNQSASSLLVRYKPTGQLDATFADAGQLIVAGVNYYSIARQSDDRLVLAGESASLSALRLHRYTSNGATDPDFQPINGSSVGSATSLVVGSDDRITLTGVRSTDVMVLRTLPNGDADLTFSPTSELQTDIQGYLDAGAAVALQSDGKIVVAGEAALSNGPVGPGENPADLIVLRYQSPNAATATPTATASSTATATASATASATATRTPTSTPTASSSATATATSAPTSTVTTTPTASATATPSVTASPTATSTSTTTPSATPPLSPLPARVFVPWAAL